MQKTESPLTKDGRMRREGRRGRRWASEVAGAGDRKPTAKAISLRSQQKRKDQPADLIEKMMVQKRRRKTECVPRGQPVAPK